MEWPKMILFDYGHTLAAESGFSSLSGVAAVMEHATANPRKLTDEQVEAFMSGVFQSMCVNAHKIGAELHNRHMCQLIYEYLQIELSITIDEVERVFWENAAPGVAMPNAARMLAYLGENGIRAGVVSNIGFSGDSLTRRLSRLLPGNGFEFVIASSEYMVRKPNPMIFELALRKARLDGCEAGAVWFCGDSPTADIEGASSAGLFAVWYDNLIYENPFKEKYDAPPPCDHMRIHDWQELIDALESIKRK